MWRRVLLVVSFLTLSLFVYWRGVSGGPAGAGSSTGDSSAEMVTLPLLPVGGLVVSELEVERPPLEDGSPASDRASNDLTSAASLSDSPSDSPADGAVGAVPVGASAAPELVSFVEVLEHVEAGNVAAADFYGESSLVRLTLLDGSLVDGRYPASRAPSLVVALLESGVQVGALPDASVFPFGVAEVDVPGVGSSGSSWWKRLALAFPFFGLLVLLVVVLVWLIVRRSRPAAPVEDVPESPKVTFRDVAGCEEAVEDLQEIVEFLRAPERFERLGAKVPRGAILVGPPGTGKTLLARAVAGEAGVPFFAQAGSDFVELYVGVGAKRVRDLFARARKHPAAIVFIDEIDAVGRARSGAGQSFGGNDERENTLIALLNELDGFAGSRVVVIAATNRVDVLDPALLRPGRLDRKVSVPNPDRRGREQILRVHVENKPLDEDVDLAAVAARTPGFSGAELAFVANEAALEAARRGLDRLSASCFSSAVEMLAMGRPRKSALVTPRDREITAWHEAGHTLVALLDPHADDPVAVSIVPRGAAGGVTWMGSSDDQFLSRERARARLAVALAGRAGEELLLGGEFTQGAASDLAHATELAGQMVTMFGMTRRGLMVRSTQNGFDKDSADAVEELLVEAQDHARALLSGQLALLERFAAELLERESLDAEEIRRVAAGLSLGPVVPSVRVVPPAPTPVPSVVSGFDPVEDGSSDSLGARLRSRFGRRRAHS